MFSHCCCPSPPPHPHLPPGYITNQSVKPDSLGGGGAIEHVHEGAYVTKSWHLPLILPENTKEENMFMELGHTTIDLILAIENPPYCPVDTSLGLLFFTECYTLRFENGFQDGNENGKVTNWLKHEILVARENLKWIIRLTRNASTWRTLVGAIGEPKTSCFCKSKRLCLKEKKNSQPYFLHRHDGYIGNVHRISFSENTSEINRNASNGENRRRQGKGTNGT